MPSPPPLQLLTGMAEARRQMAPRRPLRRRLVLPVVQRSTRRTSGQRREAAQGGRERGREEGARGRECGAGGGGRASSAGCKVFRG
eukprot:scaffold192916_cov31-Tisochrysis_lutea.AAC.1